MLYMGIIGTELEQFFSGRWQYRLIRYNIRKIRRKTQGRIPSEGSQSTGPSNRGDGFPKDGLRFASH